MNQVLPEEVLPAAANWKSYAKYKESGVEWLGEIPAHWGVTRIRRLARKGYRTFIDGDWIESPYITQEGVRLIQTGNIGIGEYCEQGFRYISEETFRSFRCTEVEPGDVLICRLADPVGRACLAPKLGVPMITSVDVCILKPDSNCDRRFLVYSLSSADYLGWMAALCRGSTRDRVSRSMLGAIEFLTPPPREQRAIANFLDRETAKIDTSIAKKERLIALLQEKRAAIISHAVTKGLDPNVPMKDSGVEWLDKIPVTWTIYPFKHIFKTIYRYPTYYDIEYVSEGIPEVRGEALVNRKIIFLEDQRYISPETSKLFPKTILSEGDIVLSVRGTMGKIGIVDKTFEGANITANLLRVSPDKMLVNTNFLAWMLSGRYFEQQLDRTSPQTTIKTVTMPQLTKIPLAIPPLSEQEVIARHLDLETFKIDALIAKVREGIESLKEYRTALISAAVIGKIDVRYGAATAS